MFLDERAALAEIASCIATGARARLAVAFWGDGAADRLQIGKNASRVEVVCNLRMGGTNPHEIAKLQNLGARVQHSDRLHAKVYMFDDKVILGSSNASSNGLGFQGDECGGWIEANIISTDVGLLKRLHEWWSTLDAREVTPKDLEIAIDRWSRNRSKIVAGPGQSIMSELRRAPTFWDGKNVFLVVVSNELDPEGEEGLETAQAELGPELDAFQDFPELPAEGYLVSFWRGPRGGIELDGLYERRRNPPDRRLAETTLNLCWKTDEILGLAVPAAELAEWRKIIRQIVMSEFWDASENAAVVDLAEVARRFM